MMERDIPSDEALQYIKEIQPEMAYCITCQPYDEGEAVWIHGIRTDLEEILDDYEVPENLRDEVARNLICNNCGCELSRYDEVGIKDEHERRVDARWKDWHDNYDDRISEFGDFLEKHPYLGLIHDIGHQIFDTLLKFPIIEISDEIWYRARYPDKGRRMDVADMYPPDPPEAEGRFNHYGQRVFYLASTRESAATEVFNQDDCLAWVQEFRIKNVSKILNLVNDDPEDEKMSVLALGLIYLKLPGMVPKANSPWKPQYFIPRFISDCARIHGFNGIVFESAKHYKKNLVLFNVESNAIESIGEPRTLELKKAERKEIGPLDKTEF